jgi:hypothetical protein
MSDWESQGDVSPPSRQLTIWAILGIAVVGLIVLTSFRLALGSAPPANASHTLPPEPEPELLLPSEPDEDYFPCSDCHEDEPTDRTVRELEDEHDDLELAHGDLWCLHCHEADDRDLLHLADGRAVDFEVSWRLCTQCHGEKLADWRAGVHGKRVGHWWGPKQYATCVSCHRPHTPRFAPIEARQPPIPPDRIGLSGASSPPEETDE